MMKIEHLLQFARLQAYPSLNQASEDLFISHQGLSKMVAALEKKFETQLIIRQANGIILTENGRYLYQKSTEIAQILGTLENTLRQNATHPLAGDVHIFMDTFTHAKLFTKIAPYLQTHHPDLSFQVTVIDSITYQAIHWPAGYAPFFQAAQASIPAIGLFTFFAASGELSITYPDMVVYPLKSSEILLGYSPSSTATLPCPAAMRPTLIFDQRAFGQNNGFTAHFEQTFDIFPVKSQFQCIHALSTANSHTYTIELAEDISSFPSFIRFTSCTPPLQLQTYYLFPQHLATFGRNLYTAIQHFFTLPAQGGNIS